MPSTPKGWLRWSAYVLAAQGRPFSVSLDRNVRRDPRLRDSRETALSVKIMLERSVNGDDGLGARLLARFYLGEASWDSFLPYEQRIIQKTARAFARRLREEGFIPERG